MLRFVLTAATAAAALLYSAGAWAQTKIVIASHDAIGSLNHTVINRFKACLERGGGFAVSFFPAGQMGNAKEIVEQLKLGAIDMTVSDTAYMSNLQPELGAFQLPFQFTDWAHAERAMDGEPGRMVADMLVRNHGIRPISFMHNGFRDFMTVKKPLTSVADFKGVKFRSPPIPLWIRMFETLGAVPIAVDWSEVYQAVQSGMVDGLEAGTEGLVNSKVYEVGKHVARSGHMYNLMMLAINDRRFQSLPAPAREKITTCGADFRRLGNAEVIAASEKAYDTMKAKGLTITSMDKGPLRGLLEPAWPTLLGNAAGTAKPLMDQIAKVR
jgi:tripartite ATP-independent transporter DctP family solute receptor